MLTALLVCALPIPILLLPGCLLVSGQRFHHFHQTMIPYPRGGTLILGIMGGREPWDNPDRGVRRLALELRAMNRPGIWIETIENKRRDLAVQLIEEVLDHNQDGRLDAAERAAARIILYGQSFGGAAVVKLARQLDARQIPVLLTVQIDSIGRGDAEIPPNVKRAANLFQQNGWIIHGEPEIRPIDAERTTIIGNFEFDYSSRKIDISGAHWFKKLFRVAHTRMDYDPEAWEMVKRLILDALPRAKTSQRSSDRSPGADRRPLFAAADPCSYTPPWNR